MERHSLRRFYGRQILKGALFASTALVLPTVAPRIAFAQIAPNTTPQGGVVVGGSAGIAQGNASTTINQTSQRAAINWQSFDVGSNAKVQFNQPDSSAVALNRVVGGNLSQINGQINANGQIVLINQSGVVFGQGSQVNAESVVVSTSDIATSDFMAGKMNFSGAPNPGAKIINNGAITARDAGLVGLVAPQVANNGLITATLGRVVLAGASAFTLDLYGDKLISLDVTGAVRNVDVNGQVLPALVTNSGLIIADGGRITLTAQDADALVTQLISAGGTLRANSVGAQTGTISVQGIGGNIQIAGNLLAQGVAAGSKGGAVEVNATGTVSVAPGAVIDASGDAGGGDVAVGTDITRAQLGPTDTLAPRAAAVSVAAGASLRADATGLGNAGTITLLSQNQTDFEGAISVQGGPRGGDGGLAEISSDGVIDLGGTVLATAINGQAGEILLDPQTLIVSSSLTANDGGTNQTFGGFGSTGANSVVDPGVLDNLSGNVVLEANKLIEVLSAIDMSKSSNLSLLSNGDISIDSAITVNGSLFINAGGSLFIGPEIDPEVLVLATIGQTLHSAGGLTASSIFLNSQTGLTIDALISTSGTLQLISAGPISEGSIVSSIVSGVLTTPETVSGGIDAPTVTSDADADGLNGGSVLLTNPNTIGTLLNFTVANPGSLVLLDSGLLTVAGPFSANIASLAAGSISLSGAIDVPTLLALESAGTIFQSSGGITTGSISVFGTGVGGAVSLVGGSNNISSIGGFTLGTTANDLFLNDADILNINGLVSARTLALEGAGFSESGNGSIVAGALMSFGTNVAGDVVLNNTNAISLLDGFTLAGDFVLRDAGSLGIHGVLNATQNGSDVLLLAPTIVSNAAGGITLSGTGGQLGLAANSLALGATVTAGTIEIAPLTSGTAQTLTAAELQFIGPNASLLRLGAYTPSGDDTPTTTAGSLVFGAGGTAVSNTTLELDAIGAITQANGALSIASDFLILHGGEVTLASQGNDFGTLQGATATDLNLYDDAALTVGGTVRAGNISLTATALTFNDPVTATGMLDLIANGDATTGTIGQGALGSISAATLTGTAGNDLRLGDAGNQIGTLAGFSAANSLLFGNGETMAIDGLVTTAGALTLQSAVSEISGGKVVAATLTSGGATISGNVSLAGSGNTISTLTNFLVGSGFALDLDDTGLLNLAGTVSAPTMTLMADTLQLAGVLDAATRLALFSSNGISQTGGDIVAGTLTSVGTINGNVGLDRANTITDLGAFSLTGTLSLNDARTLGIIGLVSTPDDVTFSGTGLNESGAGAIDATTLYGTSFSGSVLLGGANTISTLAAFTASGAFALNDSVAVTLDGLLSAPSVSFGGAGVTEVAGGSIATTLLGSIGTIDGDALLTIANSIGTIDGFNERDGTLNLTDQTGLSIGELAVPQATISASSIDITGLLDAPTDLVLATTEGGLTESTGSITTSLLTGLGTIQGDISLTGGNSIATLGVFSGTGDLFLTDLEALDVTGALAGQNVGLIAPVITLGGDITAEAASSPTLAVVTNTLINGAFSLVAAGGTIEIAPQNSGLVDLGGSAANALDIDLAIFDPSASEIVVGSALGSQAGSINVENVSFGAGVIDLFATNGITDVGILTADTLAFAGGGFNQGNAGEIIANTLASGGLISGAVDLNNSSNSIATLGSIDSDAAFSLTDSIALRIAGPVLARDITLTDLVSIALAGRLGVGDGGTIQLISDAIGASSGTISAGSTGMVVLAPYTTDKSIDLGGSAVGQLDLSNQLISLIGAGVLAIGTPGGGGITAEGSLSVSNQTLMLDGNSIDFEGTLIGPDLLSFVSTFAVSENPDAAIMFPTIIGSGDGVSLAGQNTIGTIGDFSASGNIVLNDFESLVIDGLVQTDGNISLEGEYFREVAGGFLKAATLNTGGTTISGDVFLTNANSIDVLADFYVDNGGTFAFGNGQALTIAGTVDVPSATLSAPSLDFQGLFDDGGLLALASTGSVTQDSGTVIAATLSALGTIGGDVYLTQANTIGALGDLTLAVGHTLSLVDTGLLNVAGTVAAPVATLDAGSIDIAGGLDGTYLALGASGTVAESTGTIAVDTLVSEGIIGGDVSLLKNNLISTLGAFAGDGAIALFDAENLDIAGLVSTPGTISLEGTGDISEIAGGSLSAGALNSGGTTIGGDVFLTNANTVAILTNFSVASTHTLALADVGELTLAGTILAPFATLSGSALDFTGDFDGGLLALASTGAVTQSSGIIDVSSLVSRGSIGGNVSLLDANAIASLGNFSLASGRTLALNDAGALSVAGPVAASVISLSAGSIDLQGSIAAGELALESSGTISESTGLIVADTLDSGGTTIGGDLSLLNGNSIGTLGDVSADGNIALNDQVFLSLAGLVGTAGTLTLEGTGGIAETTGRIDAATLNSGETTISGDVSLANGNSIDSLGDFTLAAGDTLALNDTGLLTVAGTVFAPSATIAAGSLAIAGALEGSYLALGATGTVAETTGTIAVDTLVSDGTVGGDVSLLLNNEIGTLGAFTAGATFGLFDAQDLAIGGLVSAAEVDLGGTGAISEVTGGTINTGLLASIGTIGGDVSLLNANSIDGLGNFTLAAGRVLALNDAADLTVVGTLFAPVATLSATNISIAGAIDAGLLALESGGSVSETLGTIAVGTLTSGGTTIGGDLLLTNDNSIASLGSLNVAGNIALYDGADLAIDGLVTAGQTITLEGSGAITQAATSGLTAILLTSDDTTIGGNVVLQSTLNSIATLANFIAANTLDLTDSEGLTLAGDVAAANVLLTAPTLTFDGLFNAGSVLAFTSATTVMEGADGAITAQTVTSLGSIDGDIFLLGDANTIGHVVNFTVGTGDTFALNDTGLLTIDGPLAGSYITLSGGTIAIPGAIDATDLLALQSSGNIFEDGGSVFAGTLSSDETTIGGSVFLTGSNTIADLADFTLAALGTLALADTGSLNVIGTVFAPTASLSAGNLDISGALDGTYLALGSGGTIFESGGTIAVATLASDGSIAGAVSLLGDNQVGTLGGFTAGGMIALFDGENLDIAGLVTTPGSISLEGSGNFREVAGGTIAAAELDSGGTTIGGNVFLTGANSIAALANFTVGGGTLDVTDAVAMMLAGTIFATNASFSATSLALTGDIDATLLALGSTGAVMQSEGTINAGTLSSIGTIGGAVSLLDANKIGDIGNFSATGNISLDEAQSYAINGLVATGGTLALKGSGLSETGIGGIRAAALISLGTLTGSAVLNGTNSINSLGNFNDTGNLFLDDATALNLTGVVGVRGTLGLLDAGNIRQTGGSLSAATLTSDGGTIGGGATLTAVNQIGTLGAFAAAQGLALNDAQALIINGNIDLGGTLALSDAANVTQSGGTIAAAVLSSGTGEIAGVALFNEAGNDIDAIGNLTALGGFSLRDDRDLALTGNIDTGGSPFDLTVPEGSITQSAGTITAGILNATALGISLPDLNAITDLGSIATGTLLVQGAQTIAGPVAATDATFLSNPGADLTSFGDVSIANSLVIDAARNFSQTGGAISAGNAAISAASNISLAGTDQAAGTLQLTAPGTISQSAGSLEAPRIALQGGGITLAGHVTASSSLTANAAVIDDQASALQAADASFTGGTVTLDGTNLFGDLVVNAGQILQDASGAVSAGTAALTGTGIALGGQDSIATLLQASGDVFSQTGGAIQAGVAVISAATSLALAGDLTALTALTLNSGGAITQAAGDITAPTATLNATQDVALAGAGDISGLLDITTRGDIFHVDGGLLQAGTLAGAASQHAQFTAPTDFGTLGSFIMQDSTFSLDNRGPLTILGPLVANEVTISALDLLTLEGSPTGGLFITGAIEPKSVTEPLPTDSVLTVTADPNGTGAEPAILQTGTFFINSGPEAAFFPAFDNQAATLFMFTQPDGTISFAPAPPNTTGLFGPSVELTVGLGTAGVVSGNVDLLTVTILSGTASNLTGILDGVSGSAASGKGNVVPFPKPPFQFNACPIGSVNCIILPIETLPEGNPLQNFDIDQRKRKKLDKNVALPGVATRDF